MIKYRRTLTLASVFLAAALALDGVPASAGVAYQVTSADDSGPGTLREALSLAGGGDAISFDPALAGSTIHLASALVIDRDVVINGLGADRLTVSGDWATRVFSVEIGVTAEINNMAIIEGVGDLGGGIQNRGNLTVRRCNFSGNSANSGLAHGAAIANIGDGGATAHLELIDSTVMGNSANREGGGIGNLGSGGTAEMVIRGSTITGNYAGNYGGGIANISEFSGIANLRIFNTTVGDNVAGISGGGVLSADVSQAISTTVEATHCTIADNRGLGSSGGGIHAWGANTDVLLKNSIIAENATGAGTPVDCFVSAGGTISLAGGNLLGSDLGLGAGYSSEPSDQIGNATAPIDPMLNALGPHGGPTTTYLPMPASPAIDAAESSACAAAPISYLDQRGNARPVDGDDDGTAHCDSGAVEVQFPLEVLFEEDFSGGFPADWITDDTSGNQRLWSWCADPNDVTPAGPGETVGCHPIWDDALNLQVPFAASTSGNGFMTVDSDSPGNVTHISQLTTPALDFTGQPKVLVQFQSHIGTYTLPADPNALMQVSLDGVTWEDYVVFPGLVNGAPNPPLVRWSYNPTPVLIDISSVAANQPSVLIRWKWTANFEFHWDLDDVVIYNRHPTMLFSDGFESGSTSAWQ